MKRFLVLALLTVGPIAYAQAASPSAGYPPQQAALQESQQSALQRAALQVAQLVDRDQIGPIWDGASPIARQFTGRDAFVQGVRAQRAAAGPPLSRNAVAVSYSRSDGRQFPPGLFANVAITTRFSNTSQPVRELVSFHLDSDQTWRVVGYTLHQ
jgi:hypothetical protein